MSAKAHTRSPKSEGRKKAETRNPNLAKPEPNEGKSNRGYKLQPFCVQSKEDEAKCPSMASGFGIRPSFGFRPSEFGFGRLAAGGPVPINALATLLSQRHVPRPAKTRPPAAPGQNS